METVSKILLVISIVILNAFFVASEIVIISFKRSKISKLHKSGNPLARFMENALNNSEYFLGVTQLGVTIASIALGWIAEPFVASVIFPLLNTGPAVNIQWLTRPLSVMLAFGLVTYLEIVLGELVPKHITLKKTELVAYVLILPLYLFSLIFTPFVKVLNSSTKLVLKILKIKADNDEELEYSEEEIQHILDKLVKSGIIKSSDGKIIDNALKLKDIPINKLMIPKPDIRMLQNSLKMKELITIINGNTHSRYPVYGDNQDDIKGFIHIKDIYKKALTHPDKKLDGSDILRKLIYVPENKKAYDVLMDMRMKHVQIAIIIDEFGMTSGLVTMEDIIESLVGNIQDEFDESVSFIKRQPDGSYLIEGKTPVEILQKRLFLKNGLFEYNTIGGMILGYLGREPKKGDRIEHGNLRFEVLETNGKRIDTIKVTKN